MDGVVLVLVGHVVGGGRSGVDAHDVHVGVLHHDTGDQASDTSESVDTHAGGLHAHGGIVGGAALEGGSRETTRVANRDGNNGRSKCVRDGTQSYTHTILR